MFLDPQIERVLREGLRREGWPRPARVAPSDRGGLTRGGITAVNWGDYRHLGRAATAGELDAISEPQALEFYFQRYVLLPHFDQILDQRLRALLIDWSFTSWSDDPTKALQRALQTRRLYNGRIDGVLGPKTIAALQRDREPRLAYRDVFASRIRFYLQLALEAADVREFLAAHPTSQLHNCEGWINRGLEFVP